VRTIEYHLHKVFTKLGIVSRHALARLVADEEAEVAGGHARRRIAASGEAFSTSAGVAQPRRAV
jgi:hypothetical protein